MKRAGVAVCIVMVLTLAALLALGVTRVRERAAMVQCANNLKQLGVALHGYHDTFKEFPSAIVKRMLGPGTQTRVVDLPVEKSASWLFEIHPFVEARMDSRFKIDINKPWDSDENRYVADNEYWIAQCPAKYSHTASGYSLENSYIGILGIGRDAGWLAADDKARGIFGFRHHVAKDDIRDGASNSMAVAETAQENGRWIAGGYPTARGLDRDGPDYLGGNGQFSSLHGVTTNVAMADGSVRKLTDKISPTVFEALATIAGGEQIEPLPKD